MRLVTTLLTLGCLPLLATGHHAQSVRYDTANKIEIEGVVTAISWRNPHVSMDLTRVGDDREEESWVLEAGALNIVERIGASRDDINVGDRIKVAGAPDRQGRNAMFVWNALLADGREILLFPDATPRWVSATGSAARLATDLVAEAERRAMGIFRVWSWGADAETSTSLTGQAQRARDAWDPADDTALGCIPQGMPGVMFSPFPIEFVDQGDEITLRVEEWDAVRSIHMEATETPEPATRLGYSVGRWEGDTLVVETSNINWPHFDSVGTPQSEEVRIREEFTLTADETLLDYSVTITDPETFTSPATITGTRWKWVPGEVIKPFNCTLSEAE